MVLDQMPLLGSWSFFMGSGYKDFAPTELGNPLAESRLQ